MSNHLATVTSPNSATIGCMIGQPRSLSESKPAASCEYRELKKWPECWVLVLVSSTGLSPRDPGCEMGVGGGGGPRL